jgi:hypothetical protein
MGVADATLRVRTMIVLSYPLATRVAVDLRRPYLTCRYDGCQRWSLSLPRSEAIAGAAEERRIGSCAQEVADMRTRASRKAR